MSNIVRLIRGDTFKFMLNVDDENSDTGYYMLKDNDALYLGITLPHQKFEDALIKKKYTKADQDEYGNITAHISYEDTADLFPGVYYYSAKLRQNIDTEDEQITTVINKTKFIIND